MQGKESLWPCYYPIENCYVIEGREDHQARNHNFTLKTLTDHALKLNVIRYPACFAQCGSFHWCKLSMLISLFLLILEGFVFHDLLISRLVLSFLWTIYEIVFAFTYFNIFACFYHYPFRFALLLFHALFVLPISSLINIIYIKT